MIIHDHSLEHECTACTTVFQLLPLQNLLFLMTKLPTTDQKVTLFLISKQHWTHTKVTHPGSYYLPVYSTPCTESACIGVAPPLKKWLEATPTPFTYWWKISEIQEPDNQPIITSSNEEQQPKQVRTRPLTPGLRLIARWSFFECTKFSGIILK